MAIRSAMWAMMEVLVVVGLVPMLALAADEDPLQDFCVTHNSTGITINGFPCKPVAHVSGIDFKFEKLKYPGNTDNYEKSKVTPANVNQFPGLNTLGISAARIDFAKDGINPPHTHPRASELLVLLKGKLYVGFVDTNNKLFATTINEGELFVFPRGLIHFQLNIGKYPALAFAALSSQNPGTQTVAAALFTSPDIKSEVLERGFRTDAKTVAEIRAKFAMSD